MTMMMSANLVGFVVGIDGLRFFASQLFGTWDGARFVVLAIACMFMGVNLMFEYRYVYFLISAPPACQLIDWDIFREEELRQGIQRRCWFVYQCRQSYTNFSVPMESWTVLASKRSIIKRVCTWHCRISVLRIDKTKKHGASREWYWKKVGLGGGRFATRVSKAVRARSRTPKCFFKFLSTTRFHTREHGWWSIRVIDHRSYGEYSNHFTRLGYTGNKQSETPVPTPYCHQSYIQGSTQQPYWRSSETEPQCWEISNSTLFHCVRGRSGSRKKAIRNMNWQTQSWLE